VAGSLEERDPSVTGLASWDKHELSQDTCESQMRRMAKRVESMQETVEMLGKKVAHTGGRRSQMSIDAQHHSLAGLVRTLKAHISGANNLVEGATSLAANMIKDDDVSKLKGLAKGSSTDELVAAVREHLKGSKKLVKGANALSILSPQQTANAQMKSAAAAASTAELTKALKLHIKSAAGLTADGHKKHSAQAQAQAKKDKQELFELVTMVNDLEKKPMSINSAKEWNSFKTKYLSDETGLKRLKVDRQNTQEVLPGVSKEARDAVFQKVAAHLIPQLQKVQENKVHMRKAATLDKRLTDLKGIEKQLHTRQAELKEHMDKFLNDAASVRLKLGVDKLKDKTSQEAWAAYQQKHQISNLVKPRAANSEEEGLALKSLEDFAKTGSLEDLKVRVTKDVPDMTTMSTMQHMFQKQLQSLSYDMDKKLKPMAKQLKAATEKAITFEAQSKECTAQLRESEALNQQLARRYHKHKSLEINAKWEFKEFHKRHKAGKVLHNRFIMQGLKSNWVRHKDEDGGKWNRPSPSHASAELVALKGEQQANEIEAEPPRKTNTTSPEARKQTAQTNSTAKTSVEESAVEEMKEIDNALMKAKQKVKDKDKDIENQEGTLEGSPGDAPASQLRSDFERKLDAELFTTQDLGEAAELIYPQHERYNDFVHAASKLLQLNNEKHEMLLKLAQQYKS